MSLHPQGLIRPYGSRLAFFRRLLDVLVILGSAHLAHYLTGERQTSPEFALMAAWGALLFVLLGGLRNIYGSWRVEPLYSSILAVCLTWLWTVCSLIGLIYLSRGQDDFDLDVALLWFGLAPFILAMMQVVFRLALKTMRSAGHNTRTVAIAGKTQLGKRVVEKIEVSPWLGLRFIGYYDDRYAEREAKGSLPGIEATGRFSELIRQAREGEIDYIYITLPMRAEGRIVELVNALSDTNATVYFVPDFFVFDLLHGKMSSLDGIPVLGLFESPFYGVDGWVKRAEDVVMASLILLIVAIPMTLIALAIKLTSPGPVLFRQKRYGLNGKIVEVWKFRSMTVCENGDVVTQATRNDRRITPLGAFLRRTSLDELPQFFNVLQGGMSVVGPRPHAVAHNEQYRSLIRGYMLRHSVKPGITGWAQINGWRGETETVDKMAMRIKYDLDYVQNWSLWLDMKIIFLTIFKGFINKNAY